MATNNKLKAFVRFDGSGRIVPSSLILQRTKPKVGKWQEIEGYECCNYTTTTTTTSLNICVSFIDRETYTPSETYTYIGNDVNGYPIYQRLIEAINVILSYNLLGGVWEWYIVGEPLPLQSSLPTTTTNIFDVVWEGTPPALLILTTPCDRP